MPARTATQEVRDGDHLREIAATGRLKGRVGKKILPKVEPPRISASPTAYARCAGMGVPVLKMTASPARPYPRNGHAVGDADT